MKYLNEKNWDIFQKIICFGGWCLAYSLGAKSETKASTLVQRLPPASLCIVRCVNCCRYFCNEKKKKKMVQRLPPDASLTVLSALFTLLAAADIFAMQQLRPLYCIAKISADCDTQAAVSQSATPTYSFITHDLSGASRSRSLVSTTAVHCALEAKRELFCQPNLHCFITMPHPIIGTFWRSVCNCKY